MYVLISAMWSCSFYAVILHTYPCAHVLGKTNDDGAVSCGIDGVVGLAFSIGPHSTLPLRSILGANSRTAFAGPFGYPVWRLGLTVVWSPHGPSE